VKHTGDEDHRSRNGILSNKECNGVCKGIDTTYSKKELISTIFSNINQTFVH
jgi:hypothetical protein